MDSIPMQVRKLWEVVLFSRREWPSMQRRDSVVKGLIRARLVGNVTSTERVAEGKRIFDFGQAGFMMAKVGHAGSCSYPLSSYAQCRT